MVLFMWKLHNAVSTSICPSRYCRTEETYDEDIFSGEFKRCGIWPFSKRFQYDFHDSVKWESSRVHVNDTLTRVLKKYYNLSIHYLFLNLLKPNNYFYFLYNQIYILNNLQNYSLNNYHLQTLLHLNIIFLLYFLFYHLSIRNILFCLLNDEHNQELE